MPTVVDVNKSNQVVDRLFSSQNLTIVETGGAYHYYGQGPVEKRAELDWLPEPHKSKALAWFDRGHPPGTPVAMEVVEVPVDEIKRAKTWVCGICGAGPFDHHSKYRKHLRDEHPEVKDEKGA